MRFFPALRVPPLPVCYRAKGGRGDKAPYFYKNARAFV